MLLDTTAYFLYSHTQEIGSTLLNKLREWLKRVAGFEAPRMGFGAAAPKAKGPTMGLLATVPSLDKKAIAAALEAGAEALVVPAAISGDTEALRSAIQESPPCLWGLQIQGGQAPDPEQGFDFFLLTPSSALSALKGEEQGRLLEVDPSWDDVQLRVLEQLPVDGLVFSLPIRGEEGLAVQHLLAVRRLSSLLRKPLVLELGRALSAQDLELLRDGGLTGLLVSTSQARWSSTLKELKQAIEALPPRGRPKREMDAVLPMVPGRQALKAVEEEEEDEN